MQFKKVWLKQTVKEIMPEEKYVGSAMGSGNPPGHYSKSYLDSSGGSAGHFVNDSSYQSGMDVGITRSATEVGNQPKMSQMATLESRSNKTNPI